jgi:hypothetical protein
VTMHHCHHPRAVRCYNRWMLLCKPSPPSLGHAWTRRSRPPSSTPHPDAPKPVKPPAPPPNVPVPLVSMMARTPKPLQPLPMSEPLLMSAPSPRPVLLSCVRRELARTPFYRLGRCTRRLGWPCRACRDHGVSAGSVPATTSTDRAHGTYTAVAGVILIPVASSAPPMTCTQSWAGQVKWGQWVRANWSRRARAERG